MDGKIKYLDPSGNFGKIEVKGMKDQVFLPKREIPQGAYEGAFVEFTQERGRKGFEAREVRIKNVPSQKTQDAIQKWLQG